MTNLDLTLNGVTVDAAATYGYTIQGLNSLNVIGCEYTGAAPSSADFNSTVTSGYIADCSWQKVNYAKTSSPYTVSDSDYGKTFTNEGAVGNQQFDLPIVTSIPNGYWIRVLVLTAQQTEFDPNAVDQIFPTCNAPGDRLRNAGVIGANATLEYTHANGWSVVNEVGTWTDAN